MTQIPRTALAFARTHHGLVTIERLTQGGLPDRSRRRLLTDGLLVPVHQGIYRLASHEPSFEQRCLAACMFAPYAALSGPTAGRVYGLRKCFTEDIHVISGRAILVDGVHGHRSNFLDPADIVQRGPLRLLRPARLVCDLAIYLSTADLESVIEHVLERKLTSLTTLRTVGGRFMRSGRNGTRSLATVMNSRPMWTKPPESDLELRLLRALAARGLDLIPQFTLELDGGRLVRLDMADPTIRLAIEVDHVTWHTDRVQVQRDKRRDRAMIRLGWTVMRVTDEDLELRLAATIDELVTVANDLRRRSIS